MTTSTELLKELEGRGLIHPQVGEQLLGEAVGSPIRGHAFRKGVRIAEEGVYRYQEVAVITGEKLVLWMLNEVENDHNAGAAVELDAAFEASIRAVPFHSISEVSQRVAYSADGEVIGVSVIVVLKSIDNVESHIDGENPGVSHSHHYADALHFAGTADDEEADIPALLEFAAVLTRAL